jgi:RNA polymerase sigma factor (sigma-70 family)
VAAAPFQAFLDDHRDQVYRFLVASVGRDEADDCFQETFLSAMRAYPRLRPNSNLRAWVLTIAHRKALDCHRSRGRRPLPVADVPEQAVNGAARRTTSCGLRCAGCRESSAPRSCCVSPAICRTRRSAASSVARRRRPAATFTKD